MQVAGMQRPHSIATDPGRERTTNEDACLVDVALGLYVLCDGVGGNEAGEVASAIGCEAVRAAVQAGRTLSDAARDAHDAVLSAATGPHEAMGATLVAARMDGAWMEIVWAGDSPAYLLESRTGTCRRLTQPHSLIAELVAMGKLTEEEAREHPLRHTITQSLGIRGRAFSPSSLKLKLRDGDRLLLCSDGVSDVFDVAELWELAGPSVSIKQGAQNVVDAAVSASGHDNTTAVVVEFRAEPGWFARLLKR